MHGILFRLGNGKLLPNIQTGFGKFFSHFKTWRRFLALPSNASTGLEYTLRAEVNKFRPHSLERSISLAHDVEAAKGRDSTQKPPMFKKNNSSFPPRRMELATSQPRPSNGVNHQPWQQCYNHSQEPSNSNRNNFDSRKVNNHASNIAFHPSFVPFSKPHNKALPNHNNGNKSNGKPDL